MASSCQRCGRLRAEPECERYSCGLTVRSWFLRCPFTMANSRQQAGAVWTPVNSFGEPTGCPLSSESVQVRRHVEKGQSQPEAPIRTPIITRRPQSDVCRQLSGDSVKRLWHSPASSRPSGSSRTSGTVAEPAFRPAQACYAKSGLSRVSADHRRPRHQHGENSVPHIYNDFDHRANPLPGTLRVHALHASRRKLGSGDGIMRAEGA